MAGGSPPEKKALKHASTRPAGLSARLGAGGPSSGRPSGSWVCDCTSLNSRLAPWVSGCGRVPVPGPARSGGVLDLLQRGGVRWPSTARLPPPMAIKSSQVKSKPGLDWTRLDST